MHKVIIDTSVIISYLLRSKTCENVVNLIFDNSDIFQMYLSKNIFQELISKINSPKLQKLIKLDQVSIQNFLEIYQAKSIFLEPKNKITFPRDPKDAKFLELAKEIQAHYLISGDKDLLDLETYKHTIILNPTGFLQKFKK